MYGAGYDAWIYHTGAIWEFYVYTADTTSIKFNSGQQDTDFIVYGDTAAMLTLDGGTLNATFGGTVTATGATFGAGANTASFATDGELTLAGTARVNRIVNLGIDALGKGSVAPTAANLGNFAGYGFTIDDDGYTKSFEIPYDWDSTTAITVRIHWYINEAYATRSAEVRWNVLWTACHEATSPTDATGELVDAATATLDLGDVNIHTNAKTLVETEGTIAAASLAFDDVIGIRIKRVALAAGVDPVAEPVIVGLEIEYVSNKLGEAT
jgi:hypothetical protein